GALVLDREEAGHWFEIATNKSAQRGERGLRGKFDDFWLAHSSMERTSRRGPSSKPSTPYISSRPPLEKLYDSLSDEQRARFNAMEAGRTAGHNRICRHERTDDGGTGRR